MTFSNEHDFLRTKCTIRNLFHFSFLPFRRGRLRSQQRLDSRKLANHALHDTCSTSNESSSETSSGRLLATSSRFRLQKKKKAKPPHRQTQSFLMPFFPFLFFPLISRSNHKSPAIGTGDLINVCAPRCGPSKHWNCFLLLPTSFFRLFLCLSHYQTAGFTQEGKQQKSVHGHGGPACVLSSVSLVRFLSSVCGLSANFLFLEVA
jgi:hypothetical protein